MASSNRQQPFSFQKIITLAFEVKLPYLLYLPEGYEADPHKRWPVVFFLHGIGERGDDLDKVRLYGLPKRVEDGQQFPFIVVSPQCPADERWSENVASLDGLYEEILSKYQVNRDRVYLTGLSMGGQGVWRWATEKPEHFAAIAPICGFGYPLKAARIKRVPTWVFHGAKDQAVPLAASEDMVRALEACNGNVRFTVYPEAEHDSWTQTYANPELYEWLLKHSLSER